MNDLTPYIMTDIKQIHDLNDKYGDKFKAYLNKVYARLLLMQPGEKFNICETIKEPNLNIFMKCATLFVWESNGTYEFGEGYCTIRRMFVFKPTLKTKKQPLINQQS